jgi:homoserine dehydrogenase
VCRVVRAANEDAGGRRLDVRLLRGLVRDRRKPRGDVRVALDTDLSQVLATRPTVVIEALGGEHPAFEFVAECLRRGIPVASANKTLIARHGDTLERLAHAHGAALSYEAAVVAGVPFVGALGRRPLFARARRLVGILNGTSNHVLSLLARGWSRDAAFADAVARGYAEPDDSADLSGRDAAEKLAILLRLAGWSVSPDELPRRTAADVDTADLELARLVGGTIKPVVEAQLPASPGDRLGAWVGPAFVRRPDPLAHVHGVKNTLALTPAVGDAVTFTGPGAGPDVTAVTLLDDAVELASGNGRVGRPPAVRPSSVTPPDAGWSILVGAADITAAEVSAALANHDLAVHRIESSSDGVAALVWPASAAGVERAAGALRARAGRVIALPICGVERR